MEAVKIFIKEQLYLLKKAQKDKSNEEEHSNKNVELVQLLRQQKASLLEENASKNETIKIYLKTSDVTKGNKKLRAK